MRNCKCGCNVVIVNFGRLLCYGGYKASRSGQGRGRIYFFAVGGDLTLFDSQAWCERWVSMGEDGE
jgi:hypothetical protein